LGRPPSLITSPPLPSLLVGCSIQLHPGRVNDGLSVSHPVAAAVTAGPAVGGRRRLAGRLWRRGGRGGAQPQRPAGVTSLAWHSASSCVGSTRTGTGAIRSSRPPMAGSGIAHIRGCRARRRSFVSAFLLVAGVRWRITRAFLHLNPACRRLNTNSSTGSSKEAQVRCTRSKTAIKRVGRSRAWTDVSLQPGHPAGKGCLAGGLRRTVRGHPASHGTIGRATATIG